MESDFTKLTIGIIGLGLIGGSYAKGLRQLGVQRLIGVDRNSSFREEALQEGIIDEALPQGGPVLQEAELLIFCLPATAMISFIRDNKAFFHPHAVLTDVSGIKGDTAQAVAALLPRTMDFVPGHPMAGREGSGFGQSDARIFHQANYILVPQPSNERSHVELIRKLALALGCRHVSEVDPKEHDRMIAYTSSLPHVLATSLMNSESFQEDTRYFIAGSFRDGTRVADINGALWTQLFLQNKENLLEEIHRFQCSLQRFTDLLSQEDAVQLEAFLTEAAVRRRDLLIHEKHTC